MERETYKDCDQKIKLRNYLFNKIRNKYKNLIGLGGPDLEEYVSFVRSYGIKNIHIYENNIKTFLLQISKIHNLDINLTYNNIGATEYYSDVLYDLDYMCTIRTVTDDVAKFKDNFIMTFALKDRCTQIETVRLFLDSRGEEQYGNIKPLEDGGYLIKTFEGKTYKSYKYKSGENGKSSMSMTVITSF